jgi:hypothetical protein
MALKKEAKLIALANAEHWAEYLGDSKLTSKYWC